MAIRVLLVDDNPAHIELLQVLIDLDDELELAGIASDGDAGVTLAGQLQPDLIVSDIEMPRLDGLHAIPGYRRAAPTAAVVLMSSRAPGEAASDARAAGADAYIDKGTGVDTTLALVKDVVIHHAASAPQRTSRNN